MFFDNQNDLNIIINNISNDNNTISNVKEGLIKGNMFNKEYKPYKNIEPKLIEALNEENKLLLNIYELDFALIDLSLYLDLHKDDEDIYKIFKMYLNKYNDYKKLYEEKYYILCQDSNLKDTYTWVDNSITTGGIKYV